jgi:hypothetical protein
MEGSNVATYRIYAVCNACGDLHTMGTTVSLSGGPVSKQSIADAYPNKDPPDFADHRVSFVRKSPLTMIAKLFRPLD